MDALPCAPALKKRLQHPIALQCLLAGGDDYELCFTAPGSRREAIDRLAVALQLPLTRIGEIVNGTGLTVKDAQGNPITMEIKGYDHLHLSLKIQSIRNPRHSNPIWS